MWSTTCDVINYRPVLAKNSVDTSVSIGASSSVNSGISASGAPVFNNGSVTAGAADSTQNYFAGTDCKKNRSLIDRVDDEFAK